MRAALAPVLAAALGAVVLAGCSDRQSAQPTASAAPAPAPITVTTSVVEERRVPVVLDVTGTLMGEAQTEVAAETAGRVLEAPIERGQRVEAGQIVARLDAEEARWQLREAEALQAQTSERLGLQPGERFDPAATPDVRQARVALERAEADYRRYERLVGNGFVSRSEFDARRAEYLAQREQLDLAVNQARQLYRTLEAQTARVAMMRRALADTVVRAPWDGLVVERHADVGRYVKVGDRLLTLVRVDPLRMELVVPEAAIASVRQGQRVTFAVQAYPGRTFEATLAYVGPSLRADSRSLVVEARVPNPQRLLHPGLFATARIELPEAAPALFVPAPAVQMTATGARVFVVGNGMAEVRLVQVGRSVDGRTEVLRGLRQGERVATGALDRLTDGAAVEASPAAPGR
jgi:RND family efflux transporter MFP subunit